MAVETIYKNSPLVQNFGGLFIGSRYYLQIFQF